MVGHIAPEAARGGPIAAVRDGDTIVLDVESRTPRPGRSPSDELASRLAGVDGARRRATTQGVFAKYARSRRLGLGGSGDLVTPALQQLADRARRLVDPLLVLDEREADVTVAARAEADAGADRDVGLARELERELERAELARTRSGIGAQTNIVPCGGSMSQPARARPEHERVAAAAVDLADLGRVVGGLAQRDDRRDLDRLEGAVVEVAT